MYNTRDLLTVGYLLTTNSPSFTLEGCNLFQTNSLYRPNSLFDPCPVPNCAILPKKRIHHDLRVKTEKTGMIYVIRLVAVEGNKRKTYTTKLNQSSKFQKDALQRFIWVLFQILVWDQTSFNRVVYEESKRRLMSYEWGSLRC